MTDARKCAIDLGEIPADAYRLPEDKRQWVQKCQGRRAVANELARGANPDGSGITVGVSRIAKLLKMSESTVRLYFLDLIKLGLLTNEKRLWRGNRVRRLNVAALSSSESEALSSSESEVHPPKVSLHPPKVTISSSESQSSSAESEASSSESEAIENHVKPVDSPVTTSFGGCTALPLNTDNHRHHREIRERELVVEQKPAAMVSDTKAVIEKLSYIFMKKVEQPLRQHKTDPVELARLLKRTKEEPLIEAWKLYLWRTAHWFVGEGKTVCPLYVFLKEARNWLDLVASGERIKDDASLTKAQIAATNRFSDSTTPVARLDPEFIETLSPDELEYIAKVKAAVTVSDLPEEAPARSIDLGKRNLEFSVQRRAKREQEDQEAADGLFN